MRHILAHSGVLLGMNIRHVIDYLESVLEHERLSPIAECGPPGVENALAAAKEVANAIRVIRKESYEIADPNNHS